MEGLSALVLSASLLGLTLAPPSGGSASLVTSPPTGQPAPSAWYLLLEDAEAEAAAGENEAAEAPEGEAVAEADGGGDRLERARHRARLTSAHRALGISTWASMTATLVFGALQFADKYTFDDAGQNRCERGEPILGSWNCDFPVMHLGFAFLTTALYGTTLALSFAMHDDELSQGEGSRGTRLRIHRALRWVHLAGMVVQIVEGLILANVDFDDDTGQAIGAVHLGLGGLTWAVLTWAGATMLAR